MEFGSVLKQSAGIRAVVGHAGMTFLEDDRLMLELAYVPSDDIPFVVHNTQIANVTSIIQRGLIPGGGVTSVVNSQLSAFHLMDRRLPTGQQLALIKILSLHQPHPGEGEGGGGG